jgi:hypothetical protein
MRMLDHCVPLGLVLALVAGCDGSIAAGRLDGGDRPDAAAWDAPAHADDGGALPPEAGVPADGAPADAAPPDGPCVDDCPVYPGVAWGCTTRFVYGTNWAWRHWAGDFGGISRWGQAGVAGDSAAVSDGLAQMKAAGVNVIRWWMFPRFYTESITFGADDAPSGIGGTLIADVQAALALAEQQDVFIMLTPFSFDSFTPSRIDYGIYAPGLQPIVVDASRRLHLLANLMAPLADAVEQSPYRHRMIAWDMINEPEWAMTGASLYGGEGFSPSASLQPVTHAEMETFLNELAAVLHDHSSALVTVGSAAIKWASAWTHTDVDFYQLHYYDWVYEWYPYTTVTLASVGLTDKPVIMGEFPNQGLSAIASKGLPARTAAELIDDLWVANYAGALSWAFNDSAFPWDPAILQPFASEHACETRF